MRREHETPSPPVGPRTLAHEALWRIELIERRLMQVQAMSTRAYEAAQDWPGLINDARQSPEYERSFVGEPLVSVRMPTYNRASLLCEQALPSIQAQSYEHWEAIIVGDQCTDDTAERVAAIGDPRISFTNRSFRGPYPKDSFNRWALSGVNPSNDAIAASRGGWIASLDDDDEWDTNHLATLVRAAQESRSEVIYARARVMNTATGEQNSDIGAWPPVEGQIPLLTTLVHGSFRSLRFDPNTQFAGEVHDWNYARRLWEAGARFHFVDQVLATHFHTPKVETQTIELQMINELRDWCGQLEDARDYWRARAEAAEALRGGDDTP